MLASGKVTMEGELRAFIEVWVSALASLTYCYFISFIIPKGKFRFLSFLPIFYLFITLPLKLTTIIPGTMAAFFFTWLANFKLLLFSFGQGPLSSNPSIPLSHFISIACFPIMIKGDTSTPKLEKLLHLETTETLPPQSSTSKSPLSMIIKIIIILLLMFVNKHIQHIHPKLLLVYYICYVYNWLEFLLAMIALVVRVLLGLELAPQFNKPYLATSPQDFWGRRWNLMATQILKPTVHLPMKFISTKLIGRKWASLPAILCTFLVSGLMHEIMYMYMGRVGPSWELTWFFILQGIIVDMEVVGKKVMKEKWGLPSVISVPITLVILGLMADKLFFPPILRCRIDVAAERELLAMVDFFRNLVNSVA